ncbi:acylneuraminate cytidylyltransferase family protein [Candidatus Thioglobus sp.]|jgi:CMP-N,N'-diacetyllegionaminic acid synthase|nr:acylneuraminate cytidylyltransferase family protein [Candidatus Thioglobus sp.]
MKRTTSSKIVALIPARSGSKGIPNKNIQLLNGEPVLAYSIKAALQSKLIDRVIVSTDSQEYAEIAKFHGAEVPFLRPQEISQDSATDLQFFEHTIDWFKNNETNVPEYFVHLRPTTPLRYADKIDKAITEFIDAGSNYTALRSCHAMSESSYKTFEIEDKKLKGLCDYGFNIEGLNFGRQTYPRTYDCNGYVDIIRSELVNKKAAVHGDNVLAYITETAYEIDEPSDLDLIEYIILKHPQYVKKLFK